MKKRVLTEGGVRHEIKHTGSKRPNAPPPSPTPGGSFTVKYRYVVNLDELIKLKEEYLLTLDNEQGVEFYETHHQTASDIMEGFIDWLNVNMKVVEINDK